MIWRFVNQPVAAPTVAVDMNAWEILINMDKSFRVDAPPLRRQFNQNSMVDGALLTSSAFENRVLEFSLAFQGSVMQKATNFNRVLAELAKPSNLLMYQPNESMPPVFFRTFKSDDIAIQHRGGSKGAWAMDCKVIAEPFAIGLRVDKVAGAVITNDPAAGTNPMRLDISGIIGDVASPAYVRMSTLSAGGRLVMSQRTVNNPTAVTVFAQAESGTMGTDTTTQANSALFSGSGNNFTRTTFVNNSIAVNRLTLAVPSASSPEALRGKYRVFMRCRSGSAVATAYLLRYQAGTNDFFTGPQVRYVGGTAQAFTHLDLGVIEFPLVTAAPPVLGYSNLPAGYTQQTIVIQGSQVSGTAPLDIDYVYLLPADERMCAVHQPVTVAGGYIVLDGPQDAVYGMASGTTPFGATRTVNNAGGLVSRIGSLPMLIPGVVNRWHLIDTDDAITATNTLDVYYWPRWCEVATS